MRVDFDPGQYAQYTLISQNGTNFLKGSDIYYSFLLGRRVFGGPFVWAQAKFLRIHNIISPHFSVTITFYFVYGSSFPSDGQFIYTTENNITVSKFITNTTLSNTDETKQDRADERILHNTSLLTIAWECYGPNNEPVQGFCGFHTYYIIVHNCQPYCLDATTCTLWNSTYDSSFIKFSQAESILSQRVCKMFRLSIILFNLYIINRLLNLHIYLYLNQIRMYVQNELIRRIRSMF